MKKVINGSSLGKENVTINKLFGDRILCEIIEVEPVKKSGIINPHTQEDFKEGDAHYDRYFLRAKIVDLGEAAKEKGLNAGDTVFFEDRRAMTHILVNQKGLALTRSSNIILSYSENE